MTDLRDMARCLWCGSTSPLLMFSYAGTGCTLVDHHPWHDQSAREFAEDVYEKARVEQFATPENP